MPLHEASSVDVAKLLRHDVDVTAEDEDGRTPLHEASLACSGEAWRLLG